MIFAKTLTDRHDRVEKAVALSRRKYELSIVADWRYPQFFQFLQLSPSYRLAHLIAQGKLDRQKCVLPKDFEVVEATYAAFGDVTRTSFWDWWLKTAQYQFGVSAAPRAKSLLKIKLREDVTDGMIKATHEQLDEFVMVDRPAQGNLATLVLAVPLHNDRKALLKEIALLIDSEYGIERQQSGIAAYHMLRNKMRERTLIMARNVVLGRAARPKAKLFVIGNITKVSPTHWSDPNVKRDKVEAGKRETMEVLTSRHINRAYTLAENAARGTFPSLDPLPEDPNRPIFNYVELQNQFKAYMRYLEKEIERSKARRSKRNFIRSQVSQTVK